MIILWFKLEIKFIFARRASVLSVIENISKAEVLETLILYIGCLEFFFNYLSYKLSVNKKEKQQW